MQSVLFAIARCTFRGLNANAPSPVPPEELIAIVTEMPEGVQIIDRAWRYVFLNAAAAAHGRRPSDELVGKTMMECYPGIEASPMFAMLSRCMETGTASAMENEFRYADGTRRIFELRVAPCSIGVMILSIDVTERRKLELQLRQAQKMEAIGRLAGSIAHDFNNALSVILSFSSLILEDLRPLDPLCADIQAIMRAGERAADLTRQLLAFSRQQVIAPRLVDLNRALNAVASTLGRVVGETVEVVMRVERDVSPVLIDPGQLDQIVMNLVINARDAMPSGGTLVLETKDVVLDDTYSSEHFGVTPGNYVMLAVSDTGVGMDVETQLHIYEPFFTTKPVGQGTGLGLSTVFGIVKPSGGSIWVYSEPGAGATFKVYLPSADDATPRDPVELPEPRDLRGTETVLVVEDHDDVRLVTREVLRRMGYNVLSARNAGEALLTCERHPGVIDLLLTDVVMPQMGGRELAERLSLLRPAMKIVFMSGYTENAAVRAAMLDPGIAYVQKPIIPETLARTLRAVLDAPAQPDF